MSDMDLRRLVLRYGVGWGGLTAVALVAVGAAASFPPKLLGAVMVGVGLVVGPLAVGVTDSVIETAAASARIGFDAGDPSQYQDDGVPVLYPLKVACWSTVVGVAGVVLLALTS